MEAGALAGLRRRPAGEEERGGPGDAKRARRNVEAGAGEDADQGPNGLPRVGWTNLNGLSESKGFFAQEVLPGNMQVRQSSLGHFNHTVNC